jgi:5-methyltetrahydropteroyltriglutamate--homocysteine methyltransferase
MSDQLSFLTHEVGSLAKPPWLVKASAGRPLGEADREHARRWGERLEVPRHEDLLDLLARPELDQEAKRELGRWSSHYAVRLLESAGLDVVYDGEQQRTEMYAWAVEHANGFEPRGTVRSFDNKYYAKSAVVAPPSLREPYHNDELRFLQSVADADLKIPVTGAYTLAIWSYDEHYAGGGRLGAGLGRSHEIRARREFALDIARHLIRPNLEALIELGATWIQIDEPGASTEPDELEVFVESFNESVEGLDCFFSTHLCFSDYDLFFPAIEGMDGCRQYAVGFANYDSRELGVSAGARPGYEVISRFRDLDYRPILGLGVLDIHTDFVEPPELVRDRILHAVEVFGDPSRIHVTPDCGLRTRSWEVAYEKLVNMVEGTRLAAGAVSGTGAATTG